MQLCIFPCDTIWGILGLATESVATKLATLKGRPLDKGFVTLIPNQTHLKNWVSHISNTQQTLMDQFWPGPLTILLSSRADLADQIVRDDKTGCRVSGDEVARRLSSALGRPVASPSANPSDAKPANTASEARGYFGDAVDVYLDDGPRHGTPSTLVDPGPPLRILREGPVSEAELQAALPAR